MLEPFEIAVTDTILEDLALRLRAARLPPSAANDWDAGMSPVYLRELITYWRDRFDWRSQEALLNRFQHYRGEVDGTRIHFIHERGQGPSPLPLILTHGYPDSFFRFYKLIGLLTDPAAHGGDPIRYNESVTWQAVSSRRTPRLTPPRNVLWCKSSDGTEANQTCQDEGPLTLDRSRTVDEEISAKVIDFLDRNDPKKTSKPFFVWYNPARMHVTTVLSPKYEAMLGERGGKDWGVNEAGMKQMDDNIGLVLTKLEQMGQLDNTIIVFTTDNGAEAISYPDGGVTPFKGQKGEAYEGGYRAPAVIRWPGVIEPGTVFTEMFSALDWMPTFVEIAGGPKGDGLKKEIEQGAYPGIVKTTLDGINQIDYLTGKSDKSARDVFYYFSGATPSAVRYKNWKMYYTMSQPGADGWILPLIPFHFTLVDDIRRDPFEQAVGISQKTAASTQGALAAPMTAFIYDWNLLPLGQQLWLEWFETLKEFPPMQAPESYNLTQIMDQFKSPSGHPSD